MLRIKKDVDLKELEKFGFKPKYDENTGEIKEYYKEYIEPDKNYASGYYRETIKFFVENKKRIFKSHRSCCGGSWDLFNQHTGYKTIDLIYDLIQAGLVEKVEEK